ncbi:DMT family transporter [Pelagibacterium xiamenense]|uniref:DMT family transporter n=1 Tax=Pelagibacterium xiamenense TaxID=2901140 RepID=UPI001E5372E9|nr:DMT family transporter [Pelagibacterium xiamenense]MCD7060432.1 DMT family transporter [Pelagibacterium xiamenense]
MTKHNAPERGTINLFDAIWSQAYLLLFLAPLSWAGNIVASKLAVGQVDPLVLSALRWLLALAILAWFALPHVRRDWAEIVRKWYWFALYGALGFASFNTLMYGAALFTTAVNISMEQAAIPVLVMIGNFLVFKVRATLMHIAGVALTIYGVLHVATHGDPTRILFLDVNIGDGMVIGACLCYTVYSLALKFRPAVHWLSFLFASAAFAALTAMIYITLFGAGVPAIARAFVSTPPSGWLIVLYVAIFPTIVAQLCYARGVELIGPNRASIFINLLPVLGAILSVLLVGEGLSLYHFVAAIFIIGGIVLSEYAARARQNRSLKPPV